MRRSTHWIVFPSIIVLLAAMLPGLSRSQSGRSRPKVPTPAPAEPEPRPVLTIPAASSVIKQEQVGSVSRFLLRNGITVIISEQHSAPIAASVAWFKAGTRDEPVESPGVARLTEHCITAAAHRPIADLRAMGSVLRADTSFESSTYSLVVHSAKIKEALAAQADLLQKFSADAEQLRRVAALLIEEEKWTSSLPSDLPGFGEQETVDGSRDYQPCSYSIARLLNIASPDNGIARPLIPEKLGLITRDQVQSFYRTQYTPDKLIIVVAGDVVPFHILVQVQQLYAPFVVQNQSEEETQKSTARSPAKGLSPPSTTTIGRDQPRATGAVEHPPRPAAPVAEIEQTKLRYAKDRGDLNQSIVSIGYHLPGRESKDWAVIEVLSALAGMGRASRLHSSMVDRQMVASRVDSIYLPFTNAGMLIFHMQPAGDTSGGAIDKAESTFFREIDRMRREIPTEAEMNRARTLLAKRFIDRTESYAGRAQELARAEAHLSGFRAALDYRTAIGAVRAEDVQRMAAKYLTLSNTSVHEYEPLIAPPRTFDSESFAATVIAWAPEIDKQVTKPMAPTDAAGSELTPAPKGVERSAQQQAEMESIQPLPVKDFSTLNGPRAFVREDRSLPKSTIALLFQGGRLIEDERTSGTTELMLRSMLYGTVRRTGLQLAEDWEQLGAEVETIVEPDFFGFALSVMSRNADLALKFLRDCVEEPAFRDDDVQRARVAQIGAIRAARDSSLAGAQELLTRALYAGTPYALPRHGRQEVVSNLTSQQLGDWHSRAVKRQLPLAIIVGDTSGSALVSSQLAEAFRRRDLDTALPVRVPGVLRPALQIELRRREQTTAAIGLAGPKASDGAGQDAVELIKAAMNGTGGRLDRALVQKNLAVLASLGSDSAFAAGTIYAQIVVSLSDEQKAHSALLAEIEGLARNGLKADEMAAARALAAGTKIATLQSQRDRALEYARAVFAQRPASDVDGFVERLSRITTEQVKQVAVTYLKPTSSSAGIVRSSLATQQAPKQD
ncbi:MAG TPA: insulinase family protein [Blastocatellia bacterium]|nr:insulinase family protein [Blastocatellia bacterium]